MDRCLALASVQSIRAINHPCNQSPRLHPACAAPAPGARRRQQQRRRQRRRRAAVPQAALRLPAPPHAAWVHVLPVPARVPRPCHRRRAGAGAHGATAEARGAQASRPEKGGVGGGVGKQGPLHVLCAVTGRLGARAVRVPKAHSQGDGQRRHTTTITAWSDAQRWPCAASRQLHALYVTWRTPACDPLLLLMLLPPPPPPPLARWLTGFMPLLSLYLAETHALKLANYVEKLQVRYQPKTTTGKQSGTMIYTCC